MRKIKMFKNNSKIKKNSKALLAAGALLFSGSVGGYLYNGSSLNVFADSVTLQTTGEGYEDTTNVSGLPDVSDIAAQCLQSVVSITNTIEVTTTSSSNRYGNYFGFYSGYGNSYNDDQNDNTSEQTAYGSGVIIGSNENELLIATNNHVAVYDESGSSMFYSYTASTKTLTVTLADGTDHEAKLKGADEEADLAVISIPLSDLSDETLSQIRAADISDEEAKIGQGVIAIGNALGLGQSVTVGYISALNREVTVEDGYTRALMQTDAAINGGNSGGGLFNSKGELIGINSAKYSATGVEGIGYAIPISSAMDILNDLKDQEVREAVDESERGYLGIYGETVDSTWVNNYGYPKGAQIVSVSQGTPAANAGLQIGDIITAVNKKKITDYDSLRSELSTYKAGETVTLTISRVSGDGFTELQIDVTLASKDEIN